MQLFLKSFIFFADKNRRSKNADESLFRSNNFFLWPPVFVLVLKDVLLEVLLPWHNINTIYLNIVFIIIVEEKVRQKLGRMVLRKSRYEYHLLFLLTNKIPSHLCFYLLCNFGLGFQISDQNHINYHEVFNLSSFYCPLIFQRRC